MNYKKNQFVTHFNSTIYHRAGGIEAFTPVTPPDFSDQLPLFQSGADYAQHITT